MTPAERALLLAVARYCKDTADANFYCTYAYQIGRLIAAVEDEAEKPSEMVKTCPTCEDMGWEIRGGCPRCGSGRKK